VTQVSPATHEVDAWLYYGPVDAGESQSTDYDGLDLYYAVADLLLNECDGYLEVPDVEIDGESCDLRLNYSGSGIAPRPSDPIDADTLYEFDVHVDGEGERKANFNISPRFESMYKPSGDSLTFPFDHTPADEGVSIHVECSNIALDDLSDLFARALFELADDVGLGLYHGYLEGPFDGRMTAIERYLRITRSMNEKLINSGGLLDRMAMLLTDQEGTSGHYRFDNEEQRGHHHAIRHNSEAARTLIDHHRLGGQIKTYLPKDPEEHDNPNDPLHHPKVGTKLIKKRNSGGSVPWSKRHDVIQELDERLLSILSWAGIPTEAGGTTYVSDWHFDADAADEPVALHADPLPELEARQEHILMTCLRDMTSADAELTEELATDGGMHAEELSESTGLSISTVYRMLQRLDGVVESDNGHVQFVSQKIREEVRSLVESAEYAIETAAERAGELVHMDIRQSASSAFDKWMAKYGADVDWPDQDGGTVQVRLDTVLSKLKSLDGPHPRDVIAEMFAAWERDSRNPTILDGAEIEAQVRNEGRITLTATPP
jgi:transposase